MLQVFKWLGLKLLWCTGNTNTGQGFSYLSEVGAREVLNLRKYYSDVQSCENLMQLKRTGPPF